MLAENVKIQVTGTCFNVKAYASDKVIKTTLDEGSINIGHVRKAADLCSKCFPDKLQFMKKE